MVYFGIVAWLAIGAESARFCCSRFNAPWDVNAWAITLSGPAGAIGVIAAILLERES